MGSLAQSFVETMAWISRVIGFLSLDKYATSVHFLAKEICATIEDS
jgi:hypothetical protein